MFVDVDELLAVLWAAEEGLSIASSYREPDQKRIQKSLDVTRAYMRKIGKEYRESRESD